MYKSIEIFILRFNNSNACEYVEYVWYTGSSTFSLSINYYIRENEIYHRIRDPECVVCICFVCDPIADLIKSPFLFAEGKKKIKIYFSIFQISFERRQRHTEMNVNHVFILCFGCLISLQKNDDCTHHKVAIESILWRKMACHQWA